MSADPTATTTLGRPVTRYADAGGVKIAWQVTGTGPDLLIVPGLTSHVDLWWAEPLRRRFLRRLSSYSRLIRYDKRGTGLSDPVDRPQTLAERMQEIRAVVEAAESPKPIVLGWSEGGPIAINYTVANPDKVRALVLYGTYARKPHKWVMKLAEEMLAQWGTGISLDVFAPSMKDDPVAREQAGALERVSASPALFRALGQTLANTRVLPLLPKVSVPTLIIHRRSEIIPIDDARRMAREIRNSRLIELEGIDHHPWAGDMDSVLDPIEAFVKEHGEGGAVTAAVQARPRRPGTGWGSLTPAELRVVRLAAGGLGNTEIAASLYISRLTVETHLKRVFSKLGVSSRAELASIAAGNT